jgi:hypothetical protein
MNQYYPIKYYILNLLKFKNYIYVIIKMLFLYKK